MVEIAEERVSESAITASADKTFRYLYIDNFEGVLHPMNMKECNVNMFSLDV